MRDLLPELRGIFRGGDRAAVQRDAPKWYRVLTSDGEVSVYEDGTWSTGFPPGNAAADRAAIDEAVMVAWQEAQAHPGNAGAVECYRLCRAAQTNAHGSEQPGPWVLQAAKERRRRVWSDCG